MDEHSGELLCFRFERTLQGEGGRIDLAAAAMLVAGEFQGRDQVDLERALAPLEALAERARAADVGDVRTLGRFLFEREGFRGNEANYYAPENSFLDCVLSRRLGIPISLAIVCLEVGQRLGLTLRGIGFPGHFLVGEFDSAAESESEPVLLDPFTGEATTPARCMERLTSAHGMNPGAAPEYFRPVSESALLLRVLENLKQIYWRGGDTGGALKALEWQLLLVPDDPELSAQQHKLAVLAMRGNDGGRVH